MIASPAADRFSQCSRRWAGGLGYLSFPRPGYAGAGFCERTGAREVIAQLERLTCDHSGRPTL
jgi:hypothetical protein